MGAGQWQVAGLLSLAWTASLLYGELLQYSVHAPLCRDLLPNRTGVRRMDRSKMEKHFTVAVISSPRLEVSSRRAYLAPQIRSDLQLRRRFRSSVLARSAPNMVVILGDLFSRALPLKGPEWDTSLARYQHVFDPVVRAHGTRRSLRKKARLSTRVLQIPGPTDVMQSTANMVPNDEYFSQFSHAFSLELNFMESIEGAVNLVGINAAAADGNASTHHTSEFWQFVKQARTHNKADAAGTQDVVLTPLPIYTPLRSSCFSLRHSYWVQSEIDSELSKSSTARLVSTLRPTFFVAGGHEGETCWQAMQAPSSSTSASGAPKEETSSTLQGGQILLGSFNPTRAYASAPFLLLSALPLPSKLKKPASNSSAPASPMRLHLQLCITPSQFGLLVWYYILAVISLCALVLTPPRGPLPLDEIQRGLEGFRSQFKKAKLKTENGEVAYTEVVDAEGNIVAVPRLEVEAAPNQTNTGGHDLRDAGPQHRVGKHGKADRLSIAAEAGDGQSAKGGSGPGERLGLGRPPSPWLPPAGVLCRRLLSAAGPLTVLLGIQLALYLSLLASDWA